MIVSFVLGCRMLSAVLLSMDVSGRDGQGGVVLHLLWNSGQQQQSIKADVGVEGERRRVFFVRGVMVRFRYSGSTALTPILFNYTSNESTLPSPSSSTKNTKINSSPPPPPHTHTLQAHLYVTKRGHVSARCRLSPEEELLVLNKATRVCSEAADAAAKETAEGVAAHSSLGAQAGRYAWSAKWGLWRKCRGGWGGVWAAVYSSLGAQAGRYACSGKWGMGGRGCWGCRGDAARAVVRLPGRSTLLGRLGCVLPAFDSRELKRAPKPRSGVFAGLFVLL